MIISILLANFMDSSQKINMLIDYREHRDERY